MAQRIEIRTLSDGGQQPADVAAPVAAFLDGATTSLDLAQYDFNLGETTKQIVGDAIRRAAEARRAPAIRLQRRPREPDPGAAAVRARRGADRDAAGRREGDRRHPRPDAPQVRDPRQRVGVDRLAQLDRRFVVPPGERRRDRPFGCDREGVPLDFDQLWTTGDVDAAAGSSIHAGTTACASG